MNNYKIIQLSTFQKNIQVLSICFSKQINGIISTVQCFDIGEVPRSPGKWNWNLLSFLPFIFTFEQCAKSLCLLFLSCVFCIYEVWRSNSVTCNLMLKYLHKKQFKIGIQIMIKVDIFLILDNQLHILLSLSVMNFWRLIWK